MSAGDRLSKNTANKLENPNGSGISQEQLEGASAGGSSGELVKGKPVRQLPSPESGGSSRVGEPISAAQRWLPPMQTEPSQSFEGTTPDGYHYVGRRIDGGTIYDFGGKKQVTINDDGSRIDKATNRAGQNVETLFKNGKQVFLSIKDGDTLLYEKKTPDGQPASETWYQYIADPNNPASKKLDYSVVRSPGEPDKYYDATGKLFQSGNTVINEPPKENATATPPVSSTTPEPEDGGTTAGSAPNVPDAVASNPEVKPKSEQKKETPQPTDTAPKAAETSKPADTAPKTETSPGGIPAPGTTQPVGPSEIMPPQATRETEAEGESESPEAESAEITPDFYYFQADTSLYSLFSNANPESFGTGDAKPLLDTLTQYTNRSSEELRSLANAAFNIHQDRKARSDYRSALGREIDELNHRDQIKKLSALQETLKGSLPELNQTGQLQEKSLAAHEELKLLRSRNEKDLSTEEKDRLKTLEDINEHPGEVILSETIETLKRDVAEYHKQRDRIEQNLSEYEKEKNRLENLATNLSPEAKAKIDDLQAKIDQSQQKESTAYQTIHEPTIGDVIPAAQLEKFNIAYQAKAQEDLANKEAAKQREMAGWQNINGALPTDRLTHNEDSAQEKLLKEMRSEFNDNLPMALPLNDLFYSGQFSDLLMQYTDKSPQEVMTMADEALTFTQRLLDRLDLETEIRKLNPYAGNLAEQGSLLSQAERRLAELEKAMPTPKKKLEEYEELQSLRLKDNKRLSPSDMKRLQELEHKASGNSFGPLKPISDVRLTETIRGLQKTVFENNIDIQLEKNAISRYKVEKARLENLIATNVSPETKAEIARKQKQLEELKEANTKGYKTASQPQVRDVIPASRAREFEEKYHKIKFAKDYSVTLSALNENDSLALMAEVSMVSYEQQMDIAINDARGYLKLTGAEDLALTSIGLKPFTGIAVDNSATLANLRDKNDTTVFRQLQPLSSSITFKSPYLHRIINLDVADGAPVDLRGLKSGTQRFRDGEPVNIINLHGAAQIALSEQSNRESPDFFLRILDGPQNGRPTVISLPYNNDLQASDIQFSQTVSNKTVSNKTGSYETGSDKNIKKTLTINLQGKIEIPLTTTVGRLREEVNPIDVDFAIRPPDGTAAAPVHIPIVRKGIPLDTREIIAAVKAANIEMQKIALAQNP